MPPRQETYDVFKDESLNNPPPPKRRVRIDWKTGARLLVAGQPPEAVAAALGIDEDRLWRHLKTSLRFRFLLRQAKERQILVRQLHFDSIGGAAALQRSGEADRLDTEGWQWLVEATGLTGDRTERVKACGRLIDELGETGKRPPNQALGKRLEAERKSLQARFDQITAIARARGVVLPSKSAPPAPQPAPATQSAAATQSMPATPSAPAPDEAKAMPAGAPSTDNRIGIGADKDRISENKDQISKNKSGTGDDDRPASDSGLSPDAAWQPRRKVIDLATLDASYGRSVIDLTDGDGNPLPVAKLIYGDEYGTGRP